MKLLTKELEEVFKNYPYGSQDGKFGQAKVIAKFFNPIGAGTWFITEADKLENDDYLLYGYCHLGDDNNAEFGSVLLSELQNLKLPYGLTIERDMYMSKDKKLVDAINECGFEVPYFLINKPKNRSLVNGVDYEM